MIMFQCSVSIKGFSSSKVYVQCNCYQTYTMLVANNEQEKTNSSQHLLYLYVYVFVYVQKFPDDDSTQYSSYFLRMNMYLQSGIILAERSLAFNQDLVAWRYLHHTSNSLFLSFSACGSSLPAQWPHQSQSTTPTPWTHTSPVPPESL